MKARIIVLIFSLIIIKKSYGQNNDTIKGVKDVENKKVNDYRLDYNRLIVPSVLIAAGSISFAIPTMKRWDLAAKREVAHERPKTSTLDNYTQYFPALMVYGLDLSGVKTKHNFRDRTIIYASSQIIAAAIVTPSKNLIGEERPDGSNNKSFPSGHAATAFSTAHFMYREYKNSNTLLSYSGYPFAIFTGVYRVINNKHWVTDVIAGAGVGILSTELSYWLFPKITSLLNMGNNKKQSIILPNYQSRKIGLSYKLWF